MRTSTITRRTNETDISIELNLDGTGQHNIATGIGFLDHMLTNLAVHGLFDLTVIAKGDLHIDVHHTVEDVALVLGPLSIRRLVTAKVSCAWHMRMRQWTRPWRLSPSTFRGVPIAL